jgi:hypothetical protein
LLDDVKGNPIGNFDLPYFENSRYFLTANQRLWRAIVSENGGGAGRFVRSSPRAIVLRLKTSAVACDPDRQSGPRCIEVPFFVAPGNGEHAWQCLDYTCGVTVAFL